MLNNYLAVLVLSAPLLSYGAEPVDLSCGMTVKAFFSPLIQGGFIDPKPLTVAANSVNHFRPRFFKRIEAYGMPVTSLFGFTDDPLLFVRNGNRSDTEPDIYGVMVRESFGKVQAQLKAVGATNAKALPLDSHNTMIACKGEMG